jgi:hypothetical protein
MFIKTKKRYRVTYFYLAQSRRAGKKMRQWCAYIGNRLDLTGAEWLDVLRTTNESVPAGFKPRTIRDIFLSVQKYTEKQHFPFETMAGLKAAIKFVVNNGSHFTVLGLKAGATSAEIQSAFRALSRVHHPDVGGDPARFRALVAARDRLIGARVPR